MMLDETRRILQFLVEIEHLLLHRLSKVSIQAENPEE